MEDDDDRRRAHPLWQRIGRMVRSLRVRVVVVTLVLSSVVTLLLGIVLVRQIRDGLLANKQAAAVAAIDNATATARGQLAGAETNPTELRAQLARLAQDLGNPARTTDSGEGGAPAGVFEPVVMPLRPGISVISAVGPLNEVPDELRREVAEGRQAWQYTTVDHTTSDGTVLRRPALVIGAPVVAQRQSNAFGIYLVFELTTEQKTLAVVQRTLLAGGAGLVLALGLIAFIVASIAVRPIRRASDVAVRVAGGHLSERMPVKGTTELTALAGSFNDMAAAIRAQIRQLEEFGALQRRFTSDVSHELRTPLATVRMAADTLYGARDEFPPHLERATELLADELDRFEALLSDLLEVSRYDAGMAELHTEDVAFKDCVMECVTAAGPIAAAGGIRIRTDFPDDDVSVEADRRRVARIVRNLINNAIDHAEGGPVEVSMAHDDDAVAVAVTDHGVGLGPGEAALVFNRFWRADPSRQRRSGGTGLGLAIAREDARLHRGWLEAWGRAGVGARFRLTLPKQPDTPLSASPLPLRPTELYRSARADDAGTVDAPDAAGVGVETEPDTEQSHTGRGGDER